MRMAVGLALGVTALGLTACGGGSSGGGTATGSCTPTMTAAITINASGITPVNVCVLPSGTVTFKNNDTAAHQIVFDNTAAGCPQPANVTPGTSAGVAFITSVNCAFHDGAAPTNTAFQGVVAVTSSTVSGGY
jgi:plastocyanin